MISEAPTIPQSAIADERNYLRSLMAEYASETSGLEKYALTITGVIWSWCIANSSVAGVKFLFFLPAFTTLLFGMRALSVYRLRSSIREYLKELQTMAGLPENFGWETHIRRHGQLAFRVGTAKFFWFVLHASTIAVGIAAAIKLP
jgi:hypothetical protein